MVEGFSENFVNSFKKALMKYDGDDDGIVTPEELSKHSLFGIEKYPDLKEKAASVFEQYAMKDGQADISPEEYKMILNSHEFNELRDEYEVREYEKRQEIRKNGTIEYPEIDYSKPIDKNKLAEYNDFLESLDYFNEYGLIAEEVVERGTSFSLYKDLEERAIKSLQQFAEKDWNEEVSAEEYARWLESPEYKKIDEEYHDRQALEIIERRKEEEGEQ